MKKDITNLQQGQEKMGKDIKDLQQGQKVMEKKIEELQDGQRILKDGQKTLEKSMYRIEQQRMIDSNNIAQILVLQTEMIQTMKGHKEQNKKEYEELNQRITVLEVKNKVS